MGRKITDYMRALLMTEEERKKRLTPQRVKNPYPHGRGKPPGIDTKKTTGAKGFREINETPAPGKDSPKGGASPAAVEKNTPKSEASPAAGKDSPPQSGAPAQAPVRGNLSKQFREINESPPQAYDLVSAAASLDEQAADLGTRGAALSKEYAELKANTTAPAEAIAAFNQRYDKWAGDMHRYTIDLDTYNANVQSLTDYDGRIKNIVQTVEALKKKALKEARTKFELTGDDTDYKAVQEKIAGYESQKAELEDMKVLQKYADSFSDADSLDALVSSLEKQSADAQRNYQLKGDPRRLGEYEALEKELPALRRARDAMQSEEAMAHYASLTEKEDFAELSAAVPHRGDLNYRYINDIGGLKSKDDTNPATGGYRQSKYKYLTDGEIGIYNYVYNTEGKAAAEQYLADMEDTLNRRYGGAMAEGASSFGGLTGFAVKAGLDRAVSGAAQLFSKDAKAKSAIRYGSEEIRESLGDSGSGVWYDFVSSAANMAPSVLLSAATGGLGAPAAIAGAAGAASMGASAGGNAYAEARKQGYSAEKARNYATLVGASEGGLQYALGGVRALSGSGKVLAKSVGNIDKALFRIAGDVGRNMFREGTEEYAQEILGPAYRNLLLGEKNEVKLVTKDAAYAALLGALAAGFYGAVSAAKGGGLNAPEKAGTIDGATGTGKKPTKPYAGSRPKYGSTQVGDVWNAHADVKTGTVTDPSGAIIFWDRSRPRSGQWDMGHRPGQKYSDVFARYMSGEMNLDEFLKWYRNPDNYRPELPKTNRGHLYENEDKYLK